MQEEIKQIWDTQAIPVELEKLIQFQEEESGFEEYAQGFGVQADDKDGLRFGWCDNTDFLDRLYPFAQANGSGSFYAIWDDGSGKALSDMPIVVFGDEGGEYVVAKNILQLLQILTLDTEIFVLPYDEPSFIKDEGDDYCESTDSQRYIEWLDKEFGLKAVDENDVNGIISAAQAQYQKQFEDWMSQHIDMDE